jgi:ubiquinone/menaquinone biosynthesis C-methylase UbiE
VSLLRDYSRQAETYDTTRAASPSVLGPLREALAGAPGRRLVDIGGGTGNYSRALRDEGWEPLVIDREPAMLAQAAAKGLETLTGDAQELPLPDASVDAAMLVSMLHHVEDPAVALAEARRILRPGGRLALQIFTLEDLAGLWYADYFPSTRSWMQAAHPTLAQVLAHLPGSRHIVVEFRDLEDASLAALAAYPERVLDPHWQRQTSYFERMERDHPDELRAGLERLRADIEAGRPPQGGGVGTVVAWEKPRAAADAPAG